MPSLSAWLLLRVDDVSVVRTVPFPASQTGSNLTARKRTRQKGARRTGCGSGSLWEGICILVLVGRKNTHVEVGNPGFLQREGQASIGHRVPTFPVLFLVSSATAGGYQAAAPEGLAHLQRKTSLAFVCVAPGLELLLGGWAFG